MTAGAVLPDPATLTDEQLRGSACVYGGSRLDPADAVSLGVQLDPRYPGARWYPRACPACAGDRP
ncbi:hypothetical protein ACWGMW_03160 [Streptomyces albidoflavus]